MKARGNVIVVKHDKSCNLVFVRPKSDIHGYVFFTPENLSTIFWTKFLTQFFMLEIIWILQKTNQVAKKFGPIFVKKLISVFDLTFFWQNLDQIFWSHDSIFGLARWFLAWKIGSILTKKWWMNFQKWKNTPMNVGFWSNKDQIAAFVKLYNYNIAPCLHFNLVPALVYSEIHSCVCLFIIQFIHLFVHSFINLLTHLLHGPR